ncbi:glycine--tRNA ligase [Candidatus Saccharibacteria bacterium]|nr:glycine--tRNA ligase [Candidatus Saccharibacteria bacterium]
MATEKNKITMEELVSYCKRRGFVFQASEIYGGVAGMYDFGPYGVELKNNLKRAWWTEMVYKNPNIYGLDSAIIQHPKVWEASGHTERFNDPMVDCRNCKHRYRADKLAEVDDVTNEELVELLANIKCPNCGKIDWTEPKAFNLLVEAHMGSIEGEKNIVYLRGETCQGIYTDYNSVRETMRAKIPFGIAQIGKAFRNEITPGDFLFRQREFEQAELQVFVHPDMANEVFAHWKEARMAWHQKFLTKDNLRFREHGEKERAHYAKAAWDIEYKFPFGFKEMEGIHNRGDWDLSRHSKYSGSDLQYFDEESGKKYIPWIVETSVGVDRMFLATLIDAYTEEEVKGEARVVLKLPKELAPVKVAVLPLSKKPELNKVATEVFSSIAGEYNVEYDETQSIGKRYRRQDEIGTPYCVTVDFESLDDQAVTVRERDSMKQERVKIEELKGYLEDKLK